MIDLQEVYNRLIAGAYYAGKLSDEQYEDLQELHEDFERLVNCMKDHEERLIQERLIKGAELIDKEKDPRKRASMNQVYEDLLNHLEAVKRGEAEPRGSLKLAQQRAEQKGA
jgi:hypothetical protein